MLVQQTFATFSKAVMPVAAPAAAPTLGVDPSLIGVYVGIMAAAGIVTTTACGGFIIRYGALRMSQFGCLSMGIGLALSATGILPIFVIAALLLGIGTTVSTPASSHILSRYSPPKHAPLIFSIKQTGVPAGTMMAGLLIPPIILAAGWQVAIMIAACMLVMMAFALQPLRARYDIDRRPAHRPSVQEFVTRMRMVLGTPALRTLAFSFFAFVGLQSIFMTFTVTYFTSRLGYGLGEAGAVFGLATAIAIPARIFWGLIGSHVGPRRLLSLLGFAMAGFALMLGSVDPDWDFWLVSLAATGVSGTAVSFHGVLLAEVARLAPPGEVGPVTGGVLAFASAGNMVYPLLFSAILGVTGSFSIGFIAAGVICASIGIMLARPAASVPAETEGDATG